MNRVSLAFIRVFFFVMLFVSTACNKMDSSLLRDDFSAAQSEVIHNTLADVPVRGKLGRGALVEDRSNASGAR